MKRFLLWLFRLTPVIVEKPALMGFRVASDWTGQEAMMLKTFLTSPTGILLMQRARWVEATNAINGAADVFHTQHSAGRSQGFSDAVNWLESLASDQLINAISRPTGDSGGNDTADAEQSGSVLAEPRRHF